MLLGKPVFGMGEWLTNGGHHVLRFGGHILPILEVDLLKILGILYIRHFKNLYSSINNQWLIKCNSPQE